MVCDNDLGWEDKSKIKDISQILFEVISSPTPLLLHGKFYNSCAHSREKYRMKGCVATAITEAVLNSVEVYVVVLW